MRQRRFGVRTDYDFQESMLIYSIRDFSAGREFQVPYEAINLTATPSSFTMANLLIVRRMMIAMITLLVAGGALEQYPYVGTTLITVAVIGFVAATIARWTGLFAVSFSILSLSPSPPGSEGASLRIIKDGKHDEVFAELTGRWNARIKALYGQVNILGNPDMERNRFLWLLDKHVITQQEYDESNLRIVAMSEDMAKPIGGSLLN